MRRIIFMFLILLPPSLGVVDCRTACTQCQAHEEGHPEILEVYCAMCEECIERRRERKLRNNLDRQEIIQNFEDDPDECPPPPPCEPEPDSSSLYTLAQKLTSTTTTTTPTTTTTTTRRPCPPAPPCKKRKPPSRCYPVYPCMPMCPCPYPPTNPNVPALLPKTTGKTTGYLYLYIGVPKDILENSNQ